jgi:hypothetical protein
MQVRSRFPPPSSLNELEGLLIEECVKILIETMHNIYESIPRKIEAVIAAKGGPTPNKNINCEFLSYLPCFI